MKSQPRPLNAKQVENELRKSAKPEKAEFLPRFFKTGKGEYGEGDKFLGVVVPDQRKIARKYLALPRTELSKLLDSPWHECRLTGLFVLVRQFETAANAEQEKELFDFYVSKLNRVNNWDLVDGSCHKIMGPYLFEKSRKPLLNLAKSGDLWKNRVAIVTTYYFIKRDDFATTLEISEILLNHEHDLIHKAVGWMLRELGKRNTDVLLAFLREHGARMPRTMLRYAIEKFSAADREKILAGQFSRF
jgi:3-methyladenine DNA glycosylase AlkD